MGIVNLPTPNQAPVIDKSKVAYNLAIQKSTKLYMELEKAHTDLFWHVWKNANSVKASEILEKYGTDAANLFNVSSKIQEILALVNPSYQPLVPPLPLVFNENGTVIVQDENNG